MPVSAALPPAAGRQSAAPLRAPRWLLLPRLQPARLRRTQSRPRPVCGLPQLQVKVAGRVPPRTAAGEGTVASVQARGLATLAGGVEGQGVRMATAMVKQAAMAARESAEEVAVAVEALVPGS